MKVAYVYDAVYPWEMGGVQKRIWEVGRRLADRHDVHWYGLKYWDGPDVRQREGVTLHGVLGADDLYVDGRRSIRKPIEFSLALIPRLLRSDFDVIDCQSFPYFPCFSSRLHRAVRDSRLVFTWHEVWREYWYEYLGWKGVFGTTVERLCATLDANHVAVSGRTKRDVESLGVSDVELVPNGIDLERIADVSPSSDPVDVLFAGRLIEEKNVAQLVRAVDRLRDRRPSLRCVVVGDGPERERLSELVGEYDLGENVEMRGFVDSRDDVLGLMKAAAVVAHPSRREGFGMTVLEALACGTPVVTLDHPRNAASDLVEPGVTGLVVEDDPGAIAAGIEQLLTADLRENCVRAARRYDWATITEHTERFYRNLVGESGERIPSPARPDPS